MKNSWQTLRDFLDSKKVGKFFTRNELKFFLAGHNARSKRDLGMGVADVYRNTLANAGFIKVVKPGLYRKVKPIGDLSYSKALRLAYPKRYKKLDEERAQTRRQKQLAKYNSNPDLYQYLRPFEISPTLQAIIHVPIAPRTEVVKKLWGFIKVNGLQDKKNRRNLNVGQNPLTKALFGRDVVSMFEMTKLINSHLTEIKRKRGKYV